MKLKYVIMLSTALLTLVVLSCSNSRKNISSKKTVPATQTIMDIPLQGTHWRLVSLAGKPVNTSKNLKEMYIVFNPENNRAEGNGGCNAFAGQYTLKGDSSIYLGELASTKMYCPAIEYENAFFMVLSKTDHFQIHDDTLLLSEGRELNLAKFIAER